MSASTHIGSWILAILGASLLFTALGLLLLRYRRDMRAARQRLSRMGSRVIATACGPVEVAEAGEGYPLLVVHGAMGGFDQGLWLAKNASLTHYRVISVSRFGYLGSPLPTGATLDMQADAFAALLDALGIGQAAVFAVSAGSTAAIRFAIRHPQRVSALILLSPDAPGAIQVRMPPRFIFDTLLRSDFIYWLMVTFFGKAVQDSIGMAPKGFPLTPENKKMLKLIQRGDLPVSTRMDGMIFETYTCADEFLATGSPDNPYPWRNLLAPTLVLNALDDPIARPENVRRIAEQVPRGKLFCAPAGGHFFFGHMDEVKREIETFLHSTVIEGQNDLNHSH